MKNLSTLAFIIVNLTAIYCQPAYAFNGLVASVHDGDTLTVLNEQGHDEKIRIYQIDSPEMKGSKWAYQAYASEARTSLLNLCMGKVANITRKNTDKYGRTLGIVNCQGYDVATWQLDTGSAWAYRYTATKAQKAKQARAKQHNDGLWSNGKAIEPILWRKGVTQ